jgi:SPP1 family predicted phage head-tail adaptor
MDAGLLRHRVTIQSMTETQDGTTGAITESWSDVATTWAAIQPLSGREFIAAQEKGGEITARIVIRYRSDVTEKMRILHKSTVYDIQKPLPDADSGTEYLTLMVKAGRNNG